MKKQIEVPSAGGHVRPPTTEGGAVKRPIKKVIKKSYRKFFKSKRGFNPNLYHDKVIVIQFVIVNSPGNYIMRNFNNV